MLSDGKFIVNKPDATQMKDADKENMQIPHRKAPHPTLESNPVPSYCGAGELKTTRDC